STHRPSLASRRGAAARLAALRARIRGTRSPALHDRGGSAMSDPNPTMSLWHALECPFSMRVRLVLREKDQPYESHVVSLDDVGEEVRARNPKGSVPVLEVGGCAIYEAHVIAEYLEERFPDPPLYPRDPSQRARARL